MRLDDFLRGEVCKFKCVCGEVFDDAKNFFEHAGSCEEFQEAQTREAMRRQRGEVK
ncbi:MAG: hypothetical protein ACXQTS_03175 [Candidatus Methanospirareceae archaeon]